MAYSGILFIPDIPFKKNGYHGIPLERNSLGYRYTEKEKNLYSINGIKMSDVTENEQAR